MGTEQFKDNKDLYNFVVGLNTLYTIDIGKEVINTLVKSKERYQFSSEVSPQGAYAFKPSTNEFYMGNLAGDDMRDSIVGYIGHEIFHAYQKEVLGSGKTAGIDSEVEAYLFQYIVSNELTRYRSQIDDYRGGNDVEKGEQYSLNMNTMLINYQQMNTFPIGAFYNAVDRFKDGSATQGAYKTFSLISYTNKQEPVIAKFYHVRIR